jgi:O-antigen ligase
MVNIYNYLKNVWLKERENNLFVVLISLVLITIPLPYIYNSIATITLAFFAVLELLYNKKINSNNNLIYPILLFVLMVASLLWTIDFQLTKEALVKELSLFGIPICFLFLNFKEEIKLKVMAIYSYAMTVYCVYYLLNALIKYLGTGDSSVFFYHSLVTLDVNAIHVSVYFSISCIYFVQKKNKLFIDSIALLLLMSTIVLLSSKNVIITFFLLLAIYILFSKKNVIKAKYVFILGLVLVGALIAFPNKIKDRFQVEIQSNDDQKTIASGFNNGVVYNVTIKDAWEKEKFEANDYFPGAALRVYQARVFCELLTEENIFFQGYGLNASWDRIKQKRIQHNLYQGYEKFNFHNQYIQNFAELGVFGFLLLICMLVLSLKNAINNKDFIHFSFTILMISLFLTESFLWRQRGVVFFTIIYCLFNTKFVVQNSLKN